MIDFPNLLCNNRTQTSFSNFSLYQIQIDENRYFNSFIKAKVQSLLLINHCWMERERSIPFWKSIVWSKTQTVSFRIWIRFKSIFYNVCYTTPCFIREIKYKTGNLIPLSSQNLEVTLKDNWSRKRHSRLEWWLHDPLNISWFNRNFIYQSYLRSVWSWKSRISLTNYYHTFCQWFLCQSKPRTI